MTPHEDPRLEQYIHRALRELPDRRAPRSLEGRVMAALAARQATPWWRSSFDRWPVAARGAFLLLAGGLVVALMQLGSSAGLSADRVTESPAWLDGLRVVWSSLCSAASTVERNIPRAWWYGAVSAVLVAYVGLFGLGATAYRTFFVKR